MQVLFLNCFGDTLENKVINLLRELLCNEMGSFRYEFDIQVGNKHFNIFAPYVVLHIGIFKYVVLLPGLYRAGASTFGSGVLLSSGVFFLEQKSLQ